MTDVGEIPIIEFLKDKIYLGAYDAAPADTRRRVHFTIDDVLPYNNFHHDFGPLSVAHLYRFAVILHEVLGEEENAGKGVVFYSSTDPRARANAACVLCSYMVLIQSWPPHLALAPVAQAMPPLMPFRDAGYSVADFGITVQDVVYGVWRAKENNLIDIRNFNLDEYEHFEMVENGDLNLIAPHFVAFASPVQDDYNAPLTPAFEQVLDYFSAHDVRLVVRLNSHLYNREEFIKRDIKHIDLIFDDGTCPSMLFVQAFIGAVEGVIKEGGKVAVHCRAGLGRTGCLIGAHLIYTYGFTAQEAIAYMRFLRPGMVVGPQQHWLYLHQNEFREWRRTMTLSRLADDSLAGYSPLIPVEESMLSPRRITSASSPPRTPERSILSSIGSSHNALPVPTPGQPRKSPSPLRVVSHNHSIAGPRASKYNSISSSAADNTTNSDNEDNGRDGNIITMAKSRRNMTEQNIQHEKVIGRQLRVVSNPSPRRRRQFSGVDMPSSPMRRTSRVSSMMPSGVHK
ncbi:Tyrosine-protein phosphatase CDC14 [Wickerhamiella sorbophila]|uniref:Tyrosine-protein phosphatase CDC14 n=1 Tax=Wickerhamiella sorbophila TaxID=45607 RepID=A0A2T0FJ22_9ASCO|nr:Tyrosine-protein phosphatase CDC14 [Wickerhamiella sorbophila]PRT55003.1 Tyrosine-protein phosphatase CDC14 [Wickerhamiella sorbophila]